MVQILATSKLGNNFDLNYFTSTFCQSGYTMVYFIKNKKRKEAKKGRKLRECGGDEGE